jgi:hypothetical protein
MKLFLKLLVRQVSNSHTQLRVVIKLSKRNICKICETVSFEVFDVDTNCKAATPMAKSISI